MSSYQESQKEVINEIERQAAAGVMNFSTVDPVQDYAEDSRMCLTGIHLPSADLKQKVTAALLDPLKAIAPEHFFYPEDSLHMTIKNVRVINDPPHFNDDDIKRAEQVFEKVIARHHSFKVYFYRLLLFPSNLALVGTTDPELDAIILDLDSELAGAGVSDDKRYLNSRYFFSNMTLARFTAPASHEFIKAAKKLSDKLVFEPYEVDSVSLITANAAMYKRTIIHTWPLRDE